MESEEQAVVVPLVPLQDAPSTETMLRMLLNREALLIRPMETSATGRGSGLVAQASGAFAKAISQSVGRAGRGASESGLYRVILPTGSVARDLVPAVGGGFRGLVRAAGSTKIAGHATLVPAAVGTGAAIAAGPLIATVGLAVAGEILAQHQVQKKLDAIKHAIIGIQMKMDAEEHAVLTTAAQQAHKVVGYLLDRAHIPSISSAAHAFGELDTLTNTYVARLDRWVEVAQRYQGLDRVFAPDLLVSLVDTREHPVEVFEQQVAQTYDALALRARVLVLEKVAAEFSNQDRSLAHVENVLSGELSSLAEQQSHLVRLLDDLNVMQIDSSRVPVAFAGKGALAARTTFARLSRALHATPDGLPLLTDSDQTALDLAPTADGLSVITPGSD